MFGSALSTIRQSAKDSVYKPQKYEISGVEIVYTAEKNGSRWRDWEPLFEEWLPVFDEHGWLDGLNRIEIGRRYLSGAASAEYRHPEAVVTFHDDPYFGRNLVGQTKEYALIHEMTHHVHTGILFDSRKSSSTEELQSKQRKLGWYEYESVFTRNVSEYAGLNFLESVAETCAAVTLGHSYPESVKDAYYALKGPDPLAEWSIDTAINDTSTTHDSNQLEMLQYNAV